MRAQSATRVATNHARCSLGARAPLLSGIVRARELLERARNPRTKRFRARTKRFRAQSDVARETPERPHETPRATARNPPRDRAKPPARHVTRLATWSDLATWSIGPSYRDTSSKDNPGGEPAESLGAAAGLIISAKISGGDGKARHNMPWRHGAQGAAAFRGCCCSSDLFFCRIVSNGCREASGGSASCRNCAR